MVVVYVIRSLRNNFRYIGITNNLEKRLERHNAQLNKSTKSHAPFKLIHIEKFPTYKQAREREVFKEWSWTKFIG